MARPLYTDEQQYLSDVLTAWMKSGNTPGSVQDVVYAIDSLVIARMSQVLKRDNPGTPKYGGTHGK